MDEDLERFYIPMNKRKKGGSIIICHDRECGACAVGVFRQVGPDRENPAGRSDNLHSG